MSDRPAVAGGIGKTTVALAVAEALLPTHRHGVWLVDLASVGDSLSVLDAVMKALGLAIRSKNQESELVDFLRDNSCSSSSTVAKPADYLGCSTARRQGSCSNTRSICRGTQPVRFGAYGADPAAISSEKCCHAAFYYIYDYSIIEQLSSRLALARRTACLI